MKEIDRGGEEREKERERGRERERERDRGRRKVKGFKTLRKMAIDSATWVSVLFGTRITSCYVVGRA